MLHYHDDLRAVREFTARWAVRAGLLPDRGRDLMTAVSELAANTLAHTNGPGTLIISVTSSEIICQIQDNGQITGPPPGRVRPDPTSPAGKRGLWLVRQLTDAVHIATGPSGTTIRVHMRLQQALG